MDLTDGDIEEMVVEADTKNDAQVDKMHIKCRGKTQTKFLVDYEEFKLMMTAI